MSRALNFVDVDLSSRAAGFAGVFASLIAAGALTDYTFLTMPQHEYPPLLLEIRSVSIPDVSDSQLNADGMLPPPRDAQPASEEPVSPPPVAEQPPQPRAEQPPPRAAQTHPTAERPASRSDTLRTSAAAAARTAPAPAKAEKSSARAQPASTLKSGPASTAAAASETESSSRSAQQKARQLVTGLILDQIRSSLVYPQRAVQRQLQGTVVMEFTIERGIITSFRIARGSGHAILDAAATRLGEQLIGFNTRNDQHSLTLNVPIKYALIR